jgi:hypothetical protein
MAEMKLTCSAIECYLSDHLSFLHMAAMVAWRRVAAGGATSQNPSPYYQADTYNGNSAIGIVRGTLTALWGHSQASNSLLEERQGLAFLFLNTGGLFEGPVQAAGLPPGRYCNVLVPGCWPCSSNCSWIGEVDVEGRTQVRVETYKAVAYHVEAHLQQREAS